MAGINVAGRKAGSKRDFRSELTDQEVALLVSARCAGMTWREIARGIERSAKSIAAGLL